MKYIKDPVYGEIELPDDFLPVIDHPLFQRLRCIKQLSLAYFVYPAAQHSRFEHSLGVFHVTRKATEDERIWLYALLHDVGHGPFSHLTELALGDFDHEERGKTYIKEILEDSTFSVREVLTNRENLLVHGGVGSDRIDYLLRDSYFTGVRIGAVDWERLARNMWVEGRRLVVREKVLSNVEHLYVARFILGDAVYFHKTVLIIDRMFVRAVEELLDYYSAGEISRMDDCSLVSALRSTENRWWKRIEERKLFKMVFRGEEEEARKLYEKLAAKYGEEAVLLGHRPLFYSRPDVHLSTGEPVLEVSPLLRALKRSEEGRSYWFVAIDPSRIPPHERPAPRPASDRPP